MGTASQSAPPSGTPQRLPTFNLAVAISTPPRSVFALLADIQEFEPIPTTASVRMVKEPDGPTAVGTRWHEWVRIAPLWWLHVESIVTEVKEPSLLGMDFESRWLTGHLTYEIEPTSEGSILHHRETVQPRLLSRWLGPLIERGMRPRLRQRLADIKEILETA